MMRYGVKSAVDSWNPIIKSSVDPLFVIGTEDQGFSTSPTPVSHLAE